MTRYIVIGLLLLCSKLQAQVINFVDYAHQADLKVYFVEYKHEADIVVYYVDYKSETLQPGIWWQGDRYDSDRIDVWVSRYKHEADVRVFVGEYKHEVRVNDKYLQLVTETN